ncbi:MAG: methyltransferase domain-containing protein [Myxococcaceae bacterium]|nr:methyltransferase domain-containing protein [Myxococcaceae bacterium]
MNDDLITILSEPGTGSPLSIHRVDERRGQHVWEGTLRSATGRDYPVRRGIPRFVPEDSYAHNFGLQWNRFRREQLDTEQGGALSRKRFESETGWSHSLAGKWVLDAGCGAGRFAEVAASYGARLVAVDISSAVDATAESLAKYPQVDVVQGDLLNLPIRHAAVDFAYCIGVVQHTPDRARALRSVVDAVRGGGEFAFTIYPRKPWTKLHAKYLARNVTKRLDPELLLAMLERVMPSLFAVGDRLFRLPGLGRVARFASPFAVYLESERPGWSRDQRYRESLLDTLDMLAPRFDEPMTEDEVRDALAPLGPTALRFTGIAGLNVVGVR